MAVNICNMEEKDRIEKIMREENMTLSQFSLEIGVQQSTLSHILSGRNKMSAAVMKQILKRFPTISSDWILLGDGPMRRQKSDSQSLDLFSASGEMGYEPTRYAAQEVEKNDTEKQTNQQEAVSKAASEQRPAPIVVEKPPRRIKRIIVYFDDNSFQEFIEDW